MPILSQILIAFIALIHIYILYLEMVLWQTPKGQKAFNLTPEFAAQTKVLAANQGLYNGFLAAGLIWALLYPNPVIGTQIAVFFLCCVAVAGIYGAMTAAKKIIYIQTVPALTTLFVVYLLQRTI